MMAHLQLAGGGADGRNQGVVMHMESTNSVERVFPTSWPEDHLI